MRPGGSTQASCQHKRRWPMPQKGPRLSEDPKWELTTPLSAYPRPGDGFQGATSASWQQLPIDAQASRKRSALKIRFTQAASPGRRRDGLVTQG